MSSRASIMAITAAELNRVRRLADRIWPECFADILPQDRIGPMVADIYASDTLLADVAERGHVYWIAQVDGVDVGYASAYREGDRLWIKKLYLLAGSRGHGLGKKLIATAIEAFAGCSSIGLFVNDGNEPAIGFYKAHGFAVDQHVPVQMGPYRFHDYIMTRPI